jgi:hypothetical protein
VIDAQQELLDTQTLLLHFRANFGIISTVSVTQPCGGTICPWSSFSFAHESIDLACELLVVLAANVSKSFEEEFINPKSVVLVFVLVCFNLRKFKQAD